MTPLTRKITVGADPEVFVCDISGPKSAIGLLGGTKEAPRPVDFGAVQEDNVLAEFNIEPASTEEEFLHNLNVVHTTLRLLLPDGLYTAAISSHEYDMEYLQSLGRQAMEFGCDPDFNAYTCQANEAPSSRSTLRTAGGHIHVGYNDPNPFDSYDIARAMDLYLGVPSVLMDEDVRRRSMYGKSGACRIKPYGVEYRVLSNFWLRDDNHMAWAYRQAVRAAHEFEGVVDELSKSTANVPWQVIQDTINNSDRRMAEQLVRECDLEVA